MTADNPPEPLPGARLLFTLDPAVAYLNHGRVGVTPAPVQRAHQRLRDEMEANPQRFLRGLPDRIAHARRHLAVFVGADPSGTALISNVSFGVAVVLRTLDIGPGDEVLVTSHGYGAVDLACDATGATRRTVRIPLGAPDEEIVETVRAAVRPGRTKLVIVDLVSSSTARLLPARRIVSALRSTGVPVLVDGAHAFGMLPTDVASIAADFFVGNLHKWAFAPRSTALLAVGPQWRDRVRPAVASWGQRDGFPFSLEDAGTLDYTGWLAAPTGVYMLRMLGEARVRAHNAALAAYGQRVVGEALGLERSDLPDPGGPLPMRVVPVQMPGRTDEQTAVRLRDRISDELRAEVAVNAWDGRLLLRLCAQVYNRADEYDRLAADLPGLLDSFRRGDGGSRSDRQRQEPHPAQGE